MHIIDHNGKVSPSSFIPFCAFGEDMEVMGIRLDGFDDPVCNSFTTKIRNDQLCYEVDLQIYKDESKIKEQLQSGLVLILDYNEERQSREYQPNNVKKNKKKFSSKVEDTVQIFLDTISNCYIVVFIYIIF